MKRILAMPALILLAACGADGEPVQPTAGATITVNNAGVQAGANVGLRKGPFTINLGVF